MQEWSLFLGESGKSIWVTCCYSNTQQINNKHNNKHNNKQQTSTVFNLRVGSADLISAGVTHISGLCKQFCSYWLGSLLCLGVGLHLADLALPWLGWLGQPDLAPSVSSCSRLTEECSLNGQSRQPNCTNFSSPCYITFANILLVKARHMAKLSQNGVGALKFYMAKCRVPGRGEE